MPLPPTWIPFLHPAPLRADFGWAYQFGKNRRSYVLGYMDTAFSVNRPVVDSIKERLSSAFANDPRAYIPVAGWRGLLHPDGQPDNTPCTRWGQFGKDQPEHAWLMRPMRLFDALKAIAALYDAQDRDPKRLPIPVPAAAADGAHTPGELSIHPAIYTVEGFDQAYYKAYFENERARTAKFCIAAHLRHVHYGVDVPTLYEIAEGLCVTHRTADALITFATAEGLPALGPISQDRSSRGTNRSHRMNIKRKREGEFKNFSADCAIEAFTG